MRVQHLKLNETKRFEIFCNIIRHKPRALVSHGLPPAGFCFCGTAIISIPKKYFFLLEEAHHSSGILPSVSEPKKQSYVPRVYALFV
jgi:hypothetical protein